VSVVGAMVWVMLRVLKDSFVVAPPKGVTITTRLRPTPAEEEALLEVGSFLGSLYRQDLVTRIGQGKLDAHEKADSRKERKRNLTAGTSSRWAGAITRAAQDQYDLGMRGVQAERDMLVSATAKLTERVEAPVGGRVGKVAGYRSESERFSKTRRLAQLRDRLSVAQFDVAAGRPSLVARGKRLWRTRANLLAANLTAAQWESLWAHGRMFLTADGESGKRFGNETIRVENTARLSVKVPGGLVGQLGTHLVLTAPVDFSHKREVWADRVATNRAVTYRISYEVGRDRWYVHASWTVPAPEHVPTAEQVCKGASPGRGLECGPPCRVGRRPVWESRRNPAERPAGRGWPTCINA